MSASIGFRRLGIAAAVLVGSAVIALGAASYLISPEAAGNAVLTEIKTATGFEPKLRGPVSLSLFPTPQLTMGDVTLAASERTESPLTVERLVAHVRWLPLLTGRFEIADITLERPVIIVRIDDDGHTNWSPLIDTLARTVSSGDGSAPTLSFSEIRIADGGVLIEGSTPGSNETLDHVDLSLAWPSIAKTFAATGRITWRDERLDVGLSIGDFPAALVGDDSGVKLRIGGTPLKLAFDGVVGYRPNLKLDGTLAADTVSLRSAMSWVSGRHLVGNGLERFALKARTHMVGGTLGLSNLNIELDGNVAEGVLSIATRGRPMLQGTLAVDTLDLTPYGSIRLLKSDGGGWDASPIALDWFNGIDFDLRLSAARVIAAQTRLQRTAVAASLRNDRFVVTIGESRGFNGAISGSLTLTKTGDGAQMRSQLRLADVDLDTCLADLFGIRRLEGKGNLLVSLDGEGKSVMAMTRTLNGSVSLTAAKGALAGFDIEQLLRRLERRPLGGSADFRTGRTPFEALDVELKIVQGTATVEQVRFDGSSVKLVISGTAAIPTRDVDLTGTATLVAASETPPPFELPFFVQGNWDDPIMLPDTQALIRRSGAAAPLLNAVTDQRARNALRSAIERLMGEGQIPQPLPRRSTAIPIPFEPPPQAGFPDSSVPTR
ncbi:MAG: AsmA family protein [Xanthobacteraceae bacterium]